MISLTIGCGLALGSSVIVKGVDLQNQFMKEPDFKSVSHRKPAAH